MFLASKYIAFQSTHGKHIMDALICVFRFEDVHTYLLGFKDVQMRQWGFKNVPMHQCGFKVAQTCMCVSRDAMVVTAVFA